jgi:hypothetical protein
VHLNVGSCTTESVNKSDAIFERRKQRTIAKETGDHELCAIADGIDSTIFYNDALVAHKQAFQWSNDSSEVGF